MTKKNAGLDLVSIAERTWTALAGRRPELEPAVALQRQLLSRTRALTDATDSVTLPRVTPAERTARLEARMPIMLVTTVQLDSSLFRSFAIGFCTDLAGGPAGAPGTRLADALEQGRIDVGAVVAASLGRRHEAIRTKAHHLGVAPDLLWLVAELTAGPLAYRMQEALWADGLLDRVDSGWPEGFCPACGSWPAFAEQRDHYHRTLRCSFCGTAWPAPDGCIYCGNTGSSFLTAAADPGTHNRAIELCGRCGGYLKRLTVQDSTPFLLMPVVDLDTSDLDAAASEKGYARLPMRRFDVPTTLPCGLPGAN